MLEAKLRRWTVTGMDGRLVVRIERTMEIIGMDAVGGDDAVAVVVGSAEQAQRRRVARPEDEVGVHHDLGVTGVPGFLQDRFSINQRHSDLIGSRRQR